MSQPTACDRARSCPDPSYCQRCDLLVGLMGLHVLQVKEHPRHLRVLIESDPTQAGCHTCGVIAHSQGRREVRLVDVPSFGRLRPSGVAQADLALRRTQVPSREVD